MKDELEEIKRRMQRLEDREEINELIVTYARGMDHGNDPRIIGPLFAEDGTWESKDFRRFEGRKDVVAGLRAISGEESWHPLHTSLDFFEFIFHRSIPIFFLIVATGGSTILCMIACTLQGSAGTCTDVADIAAPTPTTSRTGLLIGLGILAVIAAVALWRRRELKHYLWSV